MTPRRTEADYAAMADDFEANPTEAISPATLGPGAFVKLKDGRPAGQRREPVGSTPTMSIRVPAPLRASLNARAEQDHVAPAEVVRRALAQYLAS